MPFASSNGTRIAYESTGSGEPLVLYHGLTGSAARWHDTGYAASLGQRYELVSIDARGHGASDKPHDRAAYARRKQAADVIAVLDHLGIAKTRFWGHSMGGDVALTLGRHYPVRVQALVVTGYSPFAAEGEEAAEMASWAADLAGGSQVADLPLIETPTMLLAGTEEPFVERARQTVELLPNGTFVPLEGLDHVQTFFRSDLVLPHVEAFLARGG